MKHLFDKQNKYSIRKFSIGVCSAVIGLSILNAGTAYAEGPEGATSTETVFSTGTGDTLPEAEDQTGAAESQPETGAEAANPAVGTRSTGPGLMASGAVTRAAAGGEWTVGADNIPEASVLEDADPTVGESSTQRIPKKNDTRVAVTGASATHERAGFPASNAVDNSLNTAWVGERVDGVNPTLKIDLEKIAYIDRVNYAAMQNGATALGSEYHNEAGVIHKGYIEYSTTGNDDDWHRAQITSVGVPHPYNQPLDNVAGGSGFMRQGNRNILAISFRPVEARYLRVTPTEALVGRTLPQFADATLFSAGSFLPFAYELTEIEERVTETLTTDEIHYLDDNTRYKDEREELRPAVAGSRLTVTSYEVENGVKTDRVIGQPVVTETKPQRAVWRRGTLDRPAPVTPAEQPKYTTLKETPERVVMELGSDINSEANKAKVLEKLQFPEGKTGTVTSVTPANPTTGTTATAGSDKTVTAKVSYNNIARVETVTPTSIGATTNGWEGNNPNNVLDETPTTYWVSAWNPNGNTAENPELITLKLSEEATISKIRYQSQWRVNQHGQIRKGYIEYATEETGPWTRVVIDSVTGGTGITYDTQDKTFNVADPSATANLAPVTFNITPIKARYLRLGATETNAPRQPAMVNKMVGVSTFFPVEPEVIETIEVPVTVEDNRVLPVEKAEFVRGEHEIVVTVSADAKAGDEIFIPTLASVSAPITANDSGAINRKITLTVPDTVTLAENRQVVMVRKAGTTGMDAVSTPVSLTQIEAKDKYNPEAIETPTYNLSAGVPEASALIKNRDQLPTTAQYTFKPDNTVKTDTVTETDTPRTAIVVVTYSDTTSEEVSVTYKVVDNRTEAEKYDPRAIATPTYNLGGAVPAAADLIANKDELPTTATYAFKPDSAVTTNTVTPEDATRTAVVVVTYSPTSSEEVSVTYKVVDNRTEAEKYDPRAIATPTYNLGGAVPAASDLIANKDELPTTATYAFKPDSAVTTNAVTPGDTTRTAVVVVTYSPTSSEEVSVTYKVVDTRTDAEKYEPRAIATPTYNLGGAVPAAADLIANKDELPTTATYAFKPDSAVTTNTVTPEDATRTAVVVVTYSPTSSEEVSVTYKVVDNRTEAEKYDPRAIATPTYNLGGAVPAASDLIANKDELPTTATYAFKPDSAVTTNAVTPGDTTRTAVVVVTYSPTSSEEVSVTYKVVDTRTDAEKYEPRAIATPTYNLGGAVPAAADLIANKDELPTTATYAFKPDSAVTTNTVTPEDATRTAVVVVTYSPTSSEEVSVTYKVVDNRTEAEKYDPRAIATPTYNLGGAVPAAADLIANKDELPTTATYAFKPDSAVTTNAVTPGDTTRTAVVVVTYSPTSSEEVSVTYKVVDRRPDNVKYEPILTAESVARDLTLNVTPEAATALETEIKGKVVPERDSGGRVTLPADFNAANLLSTAGTKPITVTVTYADQTADTKTVNLVVTDRRKDNEKYEPVLAVGDVAHDLVTDLGPEGVTRLADAIKAKVTPEENSRGVVELPANFDAVDLVRSEGTKPITVTVTYPDRSTDTKTVNLVVTDRRTKAQKYEPTVTDSLVKTTADTVTQDEVFAAVTVPAEAGTVTKEIDGTLPETTTSGSKTARVKVIYSDRSFDTVEVSVQVVDESNREDLLAIIRRQQEELDRNRLERERAEAEKARLEEEKRRAKLERDAAEREKVEAEIDRRNALADLDIAIKKAESDIAIANREAEEARLEEELAKREAEKATQAKESAESDAAAARLAKAEAENKLLIAQTEKQLAQSDLNRAKAAEQEAARQLVAAEAARKLAEDNLAKANRDNADELAAAQRAKETAEAAARTARADLAAATEAKKQADDAVVEATRQVNTLTGQVTTLTAKVTAAETLAQAAETAKNAAETAKAAAEAAAANAATNLTAAIRAKETAEREKADAVAAANREKADAIAAAEREKADAIAAANREKEAAEAARLAAETKLAEALAAKVAAETEKAAAIAAAEAEKVAAIAAANRDKAAAETAKAVAEAKAAAAEQAKANAQAEVSRAEAAKADAETKLVLAEVAKAEAERAKADALALASIDKAASEAARLIAEARAAEAERARNTAFNELAQAHSAKTAAENRLALAEAAQATAEREKVEALANAERTKADAIAAANREKAAAEAAKRDAENRALLAEQIVSAAQAALAQAQSARASAEARLVTAEIARAEAEQAKAEALALASTDKAAAEAAKLIAEARATEAERAKLAAQAALAAAEADQTAAATRLASAEAAKLTAEREKTQALAAAERAQAAAEAAQAEASRLKAELEAKLAEALAVANHEKEQAKIAAETAAREAAAAVKEKEKALAEKEEALKAAAQRLAEAEAARKEAEAKLAEQAQPVATEQPGDSSTTPIAPSPARTLRNSATGVTVSLAAGEDSRIVGLKVLHKETNDVATPSVLAGKDYDLFDIELVDQNGQIVKTQYAAEVILPVDNGKEVAEVIYLPNSDLATVLPFRTTVLENGQIAVVFTAPHFSEYGIVYKPAVSVVTTGEASQGNPTSVSTVTGEGNSTVVPTVTGEATSTPMSTVTGESTSTPISTVTGEETAKPVTIEAASQVAKPADDSVVVARLTPKAPAAAAPVAASPAVAAPSAVAPAASAPAQASLPETGDEDSMAFSLGMAGLMSALGLMGVKSRKED